MMNFDSHVFLEIMRSKVFRKANKFCLTSLRFMFSGPKPTKYKVFYHEEGNPDSKFVYVPSLTTNGFIQGLKPNSKIEIYVVASNGELDGPKSDTIFVTTPQEGKWAAP